MKKLLPFWRHLIGLFIVYQIVRIAYGLRNFDQFGTLPLYDMMLAFAYGFRFDLSGIFLSNGLFLTIFFFLCSLDYRRIGLTGPIGFALLGSTLPSSS